MDNKILKDIKMYAINKLKDHYSYCGVIENAEMIMIDANDKEGNDIKITIRIIKEK